MEQKNLNEEVMALPPELNNLKRKKPKKAHLFSHAIFRESFKSNGKALVGVSLANGAVVAVVVGILSTLNINATSTAMKNLFSSAGDETTIKAGSVSYYNSYYNSAIAYETTYDSIEKINGVIETNIDLVSNETLKSSISQLKTAYDQYFAATQNDDYAYEEIMKIANSSIGQLDLENNEKELMLGVVNGYFTLYKANKTLSYNEMMYMVIPSVFSENIGASYNLESSSISKVKTLLSNSINEVYINQLSEDEVSYKYAFKLGELLSDDEDAIYLLNNIEEKFLDNADKWINDIAFKEGVIKDEIIAKVISTVEENAYYEYLPDFAVSYKTSELGWPITLEDSGEKDSKGNIIYKEVELKEFDEDKFIEVDGGLGSDATTIQKMRKEALTGEAYTDEEIKQAKEDAKEDVEKIKSDLTVFMNDFISRTDNKNIYFDGNEIVSSEIENRVISDVSNKAQKELIDDYNDKYGTSIDDVYDIVSRDGGNSGKEMMNLINSYSVSAIASYKKIYQDKLTEGYSSSDASLIASSISGKGIMDQLPDKVHTSLSEMGEMNTYGIVLGGIGFALACLLIPMGYTILLSNDLVCKKVENGSLAFTFSTPIKRNTYIFTEAVYLIFTETIMAITLTGIALLTRYFGILAGSADIETAIAIEYILKFGLGNYLVTLAISGICFLSSSLFNKTSNAVGVGGGLSIFFYICSILGLFGTKTMPGAIRIDAMNFFNYLTIISFFDSNAVLADDIIYWYKLIGLVGIFIVTYLMSFAIFDKKDLPL